MTLRTTKGNSQAQDIEDLLHVVEGTNGLFENAQLKQQFALKSYIGISRLRDRIIEDGSELTDPKTSSRVSNTLGEYDVSCPAGGSKTEFLTSQFGRYEPGFVAMASMGVRVPSQPSGDAVIEWGYGNKDGFANGNRVQFGWDSTSPYAKIDKNGSQQFLTRQSDWNLDKLDGSGPSEGNPSGIKLDMTRGNIFRIVFTWYGYGDIFWVVKVPDSRGNQYDIPVHVFSPNGGTSIGVPDAPVGVLIDIGTTSTEHNVFVAGRGFGLVGGPDLPETARITSEERVDASIADGTWSPIIAVKRKTLANFATVGIRPDNIDMVEVNNPILFGLFIGNDPTDGTYQDAPTDGDSGETSLQWNNDCTSFTPGVPILRRGQVGGGGTNVRGEAVDGLRAIVPDRDPVILAAKGLGTTATVTAVLNMQEGW